MPSQKGRDVLLKIGDGGAPEIFTAIGAARTVSMTVNNQILDVTRLDGNGLQALKSDGGLQTMQILLDGLFKDAVAEEALRAAAFNRTSNNYLFSFPNGDVYAAAFIVQDYVRSGTYDGLEAFSLALFRNGGGSFMPGA
jgi:predicted secreted protein